MNERQAKRLKVGDILKYKTYKVKVRKVYDMIGTTRIHADIIEGDIMGVDAPCSDFERL